MKGDLESRETFQTEDLVLLRRMAGLMAPFWPLVLMSLSLLPVVAAVQMAQPYILKVAVDTALLSPDAGRLGRLVGLYLATLAGECVLRFLHNYTTQVAGQRFMFSLRQTLYKRLLSHSAGFHDKNPASRLMTRVTSDVESINSLFTSGVAAVAADGVTIAATAAMLLWLDWRLALLVFSTLPFLAPVLTVFRRWMRDVFRESKQLLSRMNAYLGEVISGIRVVQLFGREEKNSREYAAMSLRFRDVYHKSNLYEASLYSIVELASRLSIAALLWQGGRAILAGRLSFGTLVAAVEYTSTLFNPIRDLSAKFAILQSALASAERVFAILDAPVEIRFEGEKSAEPRATDSAKPGRIELEGVRFGYSPEEIVLQDLTLAIAPGEHVAIVGATGAGKSTFMKLLSRFYDPTAGTIRIDGVDLRELDAVTLRRTINVVMQDVFLFSGSVAENISLGDLTIPRERIEAAARAVGGDRFFTKLLGGLDAEVRERGNNLSIGERQLLSFARALVLNPRILILDEATSSVDSETELLLQQALERVMVGRTTIVIAHRLSTIRHATRILVLHKGCLVEQGTHETLLASRGVYRRLYELQYRDQEAEGDDAPSRAAKSVDPVATSVSADGGAVSKEGAAREASESV